MTQITIEILPVEDGFVAVAGDEDTRLAQCGLGAGETQAQAAKKALYDFYTDAALGSPLPSVRERVAEREAPLATPSALRNADVPHTEALIPPPSAAVSQTAILELVQRAFADDRDIRINYSDEKGAATIRTVRVYAIDGLNTPGSHIYLRGFDHEKDEGRTFRLDRISRAVMA